MSGVRRRAPADPARPAACSRRSYDTYTLDFEFTPNERTELGGFYTYEKNASTNQWVTPGQRDAHVNNLLNYAGSDRGDTFGVNADVRHRPGEVDAFVHAPSQKIDGLMDITANEPGPFYTPGRTTPDSRRAGRRRGHHRLRRHQVDDGEPEPRLRLAKATLSFGYAYEKYTYADAFSDGTSIFPQSVLFFMKGNDGGYKVNVAYAKLTTASRRPVAVSLAR